MDEGTNLAFEDESFAKMYFDIKSGKSENDELLIQILELHPFVRVQDAILIQREKHTFEVTAFSCDTRKFQRWLKTNEGKPYRNIAGGVSDDGLYTLSPMLRDLLPRGLHKIHIYDGSNTDVLVQTILFRGIPKFTGLTSSDEDETSNSTTANFFFNGNTIDDARFGCLTEKSNGENARLSMVKLHDGSLYLIAGSKNTCDIWEAHLPYSELVEIPLEAEYPSPYICNIYSEFYISLTTEQQQDFANEFSNHYGTIMGEVNRSWGEHIVPIEGLFLEVFTCLDRAGKPVNPFQSFAFFTQFGMVQDKALRKIHSEHFAIKDLDETVAMIRDSKDTEGAVLYLCNDKSEVIGLIKVKANEYVIRRRIREQIKAGLLLPLASGKVRGFPALQKKCSKAEWGSLALSEIMDRLIKNIENGMKGLTWVPGCEENWRLWAKFAIEFVHWLIEKYQLEVIERSRIHYDDEVSDHKEIIEKLDLFWNEYKMKFGTLIHTFDSSVSWKMLSSTSLSN